MMWKLFVNNVCLISLFSATVTSQRLRISDPDEVYEDGAFRLTCDHRRVQLPPNANTALGLWKVIILFKPYTVFTTLAEYLYHNDTADAEIKNIPAGRNWHVIFTGYNHGVNNIYTTKVEIYVRDAKCSDNGMYRCTVVLVMDRIGTLNTLFSEQRVKVKAKIKQPEVTLDPLINPPPGMMNQSTYRYKTKVTVTCRTEGPEGLTIKWKLEIRPATGTDILFEDFPPNHMMITHDTPIQTVEGLCPEYLYLSTLKLTISSDDTKRRYRCVVQEKGCDVGFGQVMVDVKEEIPNGPEPPSDKEVPQSPELPEDAETDDVARMYMIVCDPSQVTFPIEDARVTDIHSLQVCFMNTESQECELLAQYLGNDQTNQQQIKNIPPGRDWTITFSGDYNGILNINSMKIVIQMRDPKCTDAGKYICSVNYLGKTKELRTLTNQIIATQDDVGQCPPKNAAPSQHLTSVFIILMSQLGGQSVTS